MNLRHDNKNRKKNITMKIGDPVEHIAKKPFSQYAIAQSQAAK